MDAAAPTNSKAERIATATQRFTKLAFEGSNGATAALASANICIRLVESFTASCTHAALALRATVVTPSATSLGHSWALLAQGPRATLVTPTPQPWATRATPGATRPRASRQPGGLSRFRDARAIILTSAFSFDGRKATMGMFLVMFATPPWGWKKHPPFGSAAPQEPEREGQPGHVPRHVRDAALGSRKSRPTPGV